MNQATIITVVEGHGEVMAVPVLLSRMAAEIAPELWLDLPRPHRTARDSLIAPNGIERTIAVAAEQGGPQTGLLVLLDADDDCPANLGPTLLACATNARSDRAISVVLANREFEAWFLAAAPSLRGQRALSPNLDRPADAELPRDCKGWLTKHRTDGRAYKPTTEQAALASVFDLAMAREHSPSFGKLWRDVKRLIGEITKD